MAAIKHKFTGSIVALVTPMLPSGEIDYACLCDLIDWHIENATHGLVIMGTTGESSLVSVDELYEVVKVAIEHCHKRIPIIVGCGSASTSSVIELVKRLNPLKPDGYLCVTPYYVKPSQEGLIAHYKAVADNCDAPLLLYNVPSRTACDLSDESVIELANHKNIIGIKDAVGDIARASKLFKSVPSDFLFFSGDDETAFDFILEGGHGVISVTGNVAPKLMAEWCELLLGEHVNAEDVSLASHKFESLLPLHKKLFVEANPIPVKWALMQMNKISTGIRLPLTLPNQSSKNEITQAMKKSKTL
jgi:4-hydroxy-tetrahydrodipicolinate synthase